MNTDQLSMVPAHQTLQTTYGVLNGVQDAPPAQQVMAMAVAFHEVCSVLRLDPSQMLDAARRVSSVAQQHYSLELRALHQYIRKELDK